MQHTLTYLEWPHHQIPAAHVRMVAQLVINRSNHTRLGFKLLKMPGQLHMQIKCLPNKYLLMQSLGTAYYHNIIYLFSIAVVEFVNYLFTVYELFVAHFALLGQHSV